ncbi:hypothetical protein [Cytobacillus praedii]|uniref:hypothetical protein n=1 Tax=Cytobacillus praedii TaxID=1742358 RepID=UPI002E22D2E8|nr:hypothetical protein [Cytobacillus praedii]
MLSVLGYGEILHDLRIYKKLSIKELAEGICTEEELIQFEREKQYPRIDQLHNFAIKLNVDLSYFYALTSKTPHNYTTAVFNLINKYKRERNYHAIHHIIKMEEGNPLFNDTSLKQYLVWHQGICIYYLENNFNQAIEILYSAIDLTNPSRKNLTEREIEILTSIAILNSDEKNFRHSITLLVEALTNLDRLPTIIDPRSKLRVMFALSQALTYIGEFKESLKYSKKGIEHCIQYETLFLFSEFHYQTGENYIELGEKELGTNYIKTSINFLRTQNNEFLANYIEQELEKLLNK